MRERDFNYNVLDQNILAIDIEEMAKKVAALIV